MKASWVMKAGMLERPNLLELRYSPPPPPPKKESYCWAINIESLLFSAFTLFLLLSLDLQHSEIAYSNAIRITAIEQSTIKIVRWFWQMNPHSIIYPPAISGLGLMMTAYIPHDFILNFKKPSSVCSYSLYSHYQVELFWTSFYD